MTIPSRPAPAPPGSRAQNAAAGANASIEQLRLQLQHQQQQQQQNGGIQKLTIKLPPPPKGPSNYNNGGLNYNNNNSNSSSITRKFPQARYAPSTNWDDSPFEATAANGNFKKVPPPRPPPPRVQVNGGVRKAIAPTPPPIQSASILTNIFNRKKTAAATKASTANGASRVYGMSSGIYGSTANTTSSTVNSTNYSYNTNSSNVNWNAAWNTNTGGGSTYTASSLHTTSTSTTTGASSAEAQLISFDSPPSSPTFTQKSNSDCVSVDSFSSDSNFSSPNNGSVSQPESGFEDDFSATRSRPPTTSPLDPWETLDAFSGDPIYGTTTTNTAIGTAPVRNYNTANTRMLASNDNPLCNGKSLLPPAQSLTMPTIIKPKISQKPKAPKPPPMLGKPFSVGHYGDLATPPSPAMPQGAPPPPPGGFSLLDVISGKVDALHLGRSGENYEEEISKPYGYALYDFDGAEEGDLSFRENDKIWLLEQVSDEWYRGRTRTGCEGIFPVNYIDIKVPLDTTASTPTYQQQSDFTMQSHTTSATSSSSSGNSVGFKAIPRVRSLYNFPAEVQGDLALKENDLITILYRINEDWLYGEVDGRQGQFPSNFLEYVPDNIPLP